MFPYLSAAGATVAPVPAADGTPANTTTNVSVSGGQETSSGHGSKNMLTSMIDSVRDLPMDTKRHMLANMMFGVPMAAITMAAAGVPHLAIAPLATLIPGFLFAAFTDTSPTPPADETNGHSHGHNGGLEREGPGHDNQLGGGRLPQRGLPGLIAGLRQLYSHRREDQTLHIVTDNAGNGHHGRHGR
jgi:hypothetical protein